MKGRQSISRVYGESLALLVPSVRDAPSGVVNNRVEAHGYVLNEQQRVVSEQHTVWPEILAGNLFWRIGGFESNPPIFHPPKLIAAQCDVIIIAKSY